jgi:hypothetical protein
MLVYREATLLSEPSVGLHGLVNNSEYEILHDEVDSAGRGLYEHRMLLWPEGEVSLIFTDFTYERIAVLDRYVP